MTRRRGFKSYNEELDALLVRIAESIQLDETRKKRMESAYEAIENLLNADEDFFKSIDFEIYPQGSVKIGTTVKPQTGEEFDLDIVVHIHDNWKNYSSSKIYNELKRVLQGNDTYKEKVELKNRCIRLNYAGDFHMDILPGIQESINDSGKIMIPDRELKTWTTSNPRGYADWFLQNADKAVETILEKAFSREDLELEEFSKKKPLKRAVQLLKMYRDEYFSDNKENATSSIILTTLAGKYYNSSSSVYETIEYLLDKIITEINNNGFINVRNPKNPEENFSEKWNENPELFKSFKDFTVHMKEKWIELKEDNEESNEVVLKSLFSEEAYNIGVDAHNKYFSKVEKLETRDFSGLQNLAQTKSQSQKPYIGNDEQ